MHKPSPSRINIIMSIAAAIGINNIFEVSPAQILHKQRGKAPKGSRFKSSSVYWPAGPFCNVEPTRVKNPKIAAHVQMMHEKWLAAKAARVNAIFDQEGQSI